MRRHHRPMTPIALMVGVAVAMASSLASMVDGHSHCDDLSRMMASRMFKVGGRVYVGDATHLYSYELAGKKLHKAVGILTGAAIAIHFDVYKPCEPDNSNLLFCERARLYTDMVVLVGGGRATVHTIVRGAPGKPPKLPPYDSKALTKKNDEELLPSVNARQYATLVLLFTQAAGNDQLKFTGATFDQASDTIYLTASVLSAKIYKDPSWAPHGAHVLFASSVEMGGLIEDGFVVGSFKRASAGVIDWNGALYVLESGTNTILEWQSGSLTGKRFKIDTFFGCAPGGSPLSDAYQDPPARTSRKSDPISLDGGELFPVGGSSSNAGKVIQDPQFAGVTFYLIFMALAALLIVIIIIDCIIGINLWKYFTGRLMDDDTDDDDTGDDDDNTGGGDDGDGHHQRRKSKKRGSKRSSSGRSKTGSGGSARGSGSSSSSPAPATIPKG